MTTTPPAPTHRGDRCRDGHGGARARRRHRTAPRPPAPPARRPTPQRPSDTATESTEGGSDSGGGWAVSTDDCVDPDAANEPIEGTVVDRRGHAAVRRSRRSRLRSGRRRACRRTSTTPTRTSSFRASTLELSIADDQYDPALTPGAVNGALDAGVASVQRHHRLAEQRGRPRHAQRGVRPAARTRSPASPDVGRGVADYPWTTGGLLPYSVESAMYVEDIVDGVPRRRHGRPVLRQQRLRPGLQRRVRGARRREQPRDRRRPRRSRRRRPRRRRPRSAASPAMRPT